jgi:hypothetical protein
MEILHQERTMIAKTRSGRLILSVILLALLALLLMFAPAEAGWKSWGKRGIEGSGELATRSYDLSDFDAIHIEGVATVEVTIADEFSVELTTDDNLLDYMVVEVRRGTLILDMDDDIDNIETDEGFHYRISMPSFVALKIDGVGKLEAEGLQNDRFDLQMDGVGNVELEGTVDRLKVEMDGVGEAELRDFEAKEARIDVDGVGTVICTVTESLEANVDGMGNIKYYGDPPRVRESVDGFGTVAAR